MAKVNMHEAKTTLSRLVDRVAEGEEVVIARNGEPVALLSPLKPILRRPGRLKGRIRIAADFDVPLPPALLRAFRGRSR
jgi:prevent-host-death family protein